jgi:8-oxo-dGTP diphosphatase
MSKHADSLSSYDPGEYPAVAVTVDIALFTIVDDSLSVLLVQRGEPPYEGAWALPGGFIRPDEDADVAARRELKEETGIAAPRHLEQLKTFSTPDRDPRMRVVSIAYTALAPGLPPATAGTDAASTRLWSVTKLKRRGAPALAFDHQKIMSDALERVRSKLEYTSLATSLIRQPFTIAELRHVYEAVWDTELHAANFRRKVLSVDGFVVPTRGTRSAPGGGPPAVLYKAGKATRLSPPMLRH